jgi:hypothetical protein
VNGWAAPSGLPVQRSSAQEIADLLGHDFQLLREQIREHRTPSEPVDERGLRELSAARCGGAAA